MTIEIHPVRDQHELHDVCRLRYQIYVEELGREQRCADHQARLIREPLDASGSLLVAYDGARAVGTLRINYARSGSLDGYEALYEMRRVGPSHPLRTSVTTKLLVARDLRSSSLAMRLSLAGYRAMLREGNLHDFIDVYPARVPFFERLGYRIHIPEVVHPEFGAVIVMRLALRDMEHLLRVGSPFVRSLMAAQAEAA